MYVLGTFWLSCNSVRMRNVCHFTPVEKNWVAKSLIMYYRKICDKNKTKINGESSLSGKLHSRVPNMGKYRLPKGNYRLKRGSTVQQQWNILLHKRIMNHDERLRWKLLFLVLYCSFMLLANLVEWLPCFKKAEQKWYKSRVINLGYDWTLSLSYTLLIG